MKFYTYFICLTNRQHIVPTRVVIQNRVTLKSPVTNPITSFYLHPTPLNLSVIKAHSKLKPSSPFNIHYKHPSTSTINKCSRLLAPNSPLILYSHDTNIPFKHSVSIFNKDFNWNTGVNKTKLVICLLKQHRTIIGSPS